MPTCRTCRYHDPGLICPSECSRTSHWEESDESKLDRFDALEERVVDAEEQVSFLNERLDDIQGFCEAFAHENVSPHMVYVLLRLARLAKFPDERFNLAPTKVWQTEIGPSEEVEGRQILADIGGELFPLTYCTGLPCGFTNGVEVTRSGWVSDNGDFVEATHIDMWMPIPQRR